MGKYKKYFKKKVKAFKAEAKEYKARKSEERQIQKEAYRTARKKQLKVEATKRGRASAIPTAGGGFGGFASGLNKMSSGVTEGIVSEPKKGKKRKKKKMGGYEFEVPDFDIL